MERTRTANDAQMSVLTLKLETEPWMEHKLTKRFSICETVAANLIKEKRKSLEEVEKTVGFGVISAKIKKLKMRGDVNSQELRELQEERDKLLSDAGIRWQDFLSSCQVIVKANGWQRHISYATAKSLTDRCYKIFSNYVNGKTSRIYIPPHILSVDCKPLSGSMSIDEDFNLVWKGAKCPDREIIRIPIARPQNSYEEEMLSREMKYLRVVRKQGKHKDEWKYYVQIAIVGAPARKTTTDTNDRDIAVYFSNNTVYVVGRDFTESFSVGDFNKRYAALIKLDSAMNRSQRSMNPNNFDENGVRKPGKLYWKSSNAYKKLLLRRQYLARKLKDAEKSAIEHAANQILDIAGNGEIIYVRDNNQQVEVPFSGKRIKHLEMAKELGAALGRKRICRNMKKTRPIFVNDAQLMRISHENGIPRGYRVAASGFSLSFPEDAIAPEFLVHSILE